MKYLWLNQSGLKDNFNMQASGDFIGREYHIKVMDNSQFDGPKKVKRFRSAFTTDQVNYLEKQFKKFPYIGNAQRKEVAAALNIPERAVKIWFQNRRMKEKKESTKEFDDEQGIRKSVEFTKDPLNNLSAPSANEQPRPLPQLTNVNQETCYGNMSTNNLISNKPQQMVQSVAVRDSTVKMTAPVIQNIVTTAKVVHPPPVFVKANHSPTEFKTSAEFSIGLCKKFKTNTFTTPAHTAPSFKKEVEDIKKCEQPKPVAFAEQMLPEDLSQSRKMSMPSMVQQQSLPANASNNPSYVSLVPAVSPFYTQPYISASGVIWKPVSVMPVVTSSSSPTSGGNPLMNMSIAQDNISKGVCNCNCHVKQVMPQVPYHFPQQSPNPQYIITAVPYQNPSTKF
ncbi:protein zerknuellt 1 [Helicoverpa armigera]|uniref:protein zerknuellt 1 n=1 Tax=Helicoverpa armigera TaxID=29058 RepID=UPI003082BDDB